MASVIGEQVVNNDGHLCTCTGWTDGRGERTTNVDSAASDNNKTAKWLTRYRRDGSDSENHECFTKTWETWRQRTAEGKNVRRSVEAA